MRHDRPAIQWLGLFVVAISAIGLAGLAVVSRVYPQLSGGMLRWAMLAMTMAAGVMIAMWAALALSVAVRHRLRVRN